MKKKEIILVRITTKLRNKVIEKLSRTFTKFKIEKSATQKINLQNAISK